MNTSNFIIGTDLKQLIDSEQAYLYKIVPIQHKNNSITFKTSNSNTKNLEHELSILFGCQINLAIETEENIQQYLSKNYYLSSNKNAQALNYSDDFLLKIILEAKAIGSSDIHFEVYEDKCRIRFRIDGKLIEKFLISSTDYPTIINRIKIMANMDISEKRLPQDGRISIQKDGNEFDMRISSLPTLHGEKIVLRILSKDSTNIRLESLGFSSKELNTFRSNINSPHGIILVSGPTGSGKTTTLYSALKELNKIDTNILTVEDPIEYTLEGINQVQLKESIGLDFSNTLKTFLRQDPDIIMVGEIRDVATANIAIRAALTGHLVLSTIHTNSAWATISRLIDMGIPPFLIANTLNMSVAQRLVRKLCPICKKPSKDIPEFKIEGEDLNTKIDKHHLASGCPSCYQTGYSGRKAIYEIIPITKYLKTQIKDGIIDIGPYLNQNNISTIKSNALSLVKEGITSLEEVHNILIE